MLHNGMDSMSVIVKMYIDAGKFVGLSLILLLLVE
jgi:hypothetical protein